MHHHHGDHHHSHHGDHHHHHGDHHHHHHGHHTLWPAFSPSPLPRPCSSSSTSSSDNTDVSCTVHVEEVPSMAAPLLEPKPGDDGAVPAAPLPAILFGVAFWAIFAWIVYSYWF
ncbi:unnamed protein product [Urochloa humidicola]